MLPLLLLSFRCSLSLREIAVFYATKFSKGTSCGSPAFILLALFPNPFVSIVYGSPACICGVRCGAVVCAQASENDRFVALELLKNANIAAGMVLPGCQDTGTAIIMGKRGQVLACVALCRVCPLVYVFIEIQLAERFEPMPLPFGPLTEENGLLLFKLLLLVLSMSLSWLVLLL